MGADDERATEIRSDIDSARKIIMQCKGLMPADVAVALAAAIRKLDAADKAAERWQEQSRKARL